MTVETYLRAVCSALDDYNPTLQARAIKAYYQGWSVSRIVKHMRPYGDIRKQGVTDDT